MDPRGCVLHFLVPFLNSLFAIALLLSKSDCMSNRMIDVKIVTVLHKSRVCLVSIFIIQVLLLTTRAFCARCTIRYLVSDPCFTLEISHVKSGSEEGDHFVVMQVAAT